MQPWAKPQGAMETLGYTGHNTEQKQTFLLKRRRKRAERIVLLVIFLPLTAYQTPDKWLAPPHFPSLKNIGRAAMKTEDF